MNILAIDVGGSGVKAAVIDDAGALLTERLRVDTPVGEPPAAHVAQMVALARQLPAFERIAVGFPGMVRDGVVRTAPNLDHEGWPGFPLAATLERELGRPVRLANDADVQGYAVIHGRGLEMAITLGTGFGTSLFENGHLCPHLEIGQQPFRKGETYDQQLGAAGRKRAGQAKWQKRVLRAIDNLRTLTAFDRLFIGGGNARKLTCGLPADVIVVDNTAGLAGGAALWRAT